jgi:hypothetical protein
LVLAVHQSDKNPSLNRTVYAALALWAAWVPKRFDVAHSAKKGVSPPHFARPCKNPKFELSAWGSLSKYALYANCNQNEHAFSGSGGQNVVNSRALYAI